MKRDPTEVPPKPTPDYEPCDPHTPPVDDERDLPLVQAYTDEYQRRHYESKKTVDTQS